MAIDRLQVATVALALLDEHGLDKLTVRRVASELGVKAPALYWHFRDKRALLDKMTDLMLAEAQCADRAPKQPWQSWLQGYCGGLRRGLLGHRDGARVALGADILRVPTLGQFLEQVTGVLFESGFSLSDASRAAGALMQFVIGRTVEEQARPSPQSELAMISSADFPYPLLGRALHERHAAAHSPDDDFRYGLSLMLVGLTRMIEGR